MPEASTINSQLIKGIEATIAEVVRGPGQNGRDCDMVATITFSYLDGVHDMRPWTWKPQRVRYQIDVGGALCPGIGGPGDSMLDAIFLLY